MKVIGADLRGGKVFIVERFHDEGEGMPQVYYLLLRAPHTGRLVRVCSLYRGMPKWYRSDKCSARPGERPVAGARAEEVLAKRINKLKAGLTNIGQLPVSAFVLREQNLRRLQRRDHHGYAWKGHRVRLSVHRRGQPSRKGVGAIVRFDEGDWERPTHIVAAHRIPRTGAAIVVVRYLGINFEMGYMRDRVLLVPYTR